MVDRQQLCGAVKRRNPKLRGKHGRVEREKGTLLSSEEFKFPKQHGVAAPCERALGDGGCGIEKHSISVSSEWLKVSRLSLGEYFGQGIDLPNWNVPRPESILLTRRT